MDERGGREPDGVAGQARTVAWVPAPLHCPLPTGGFPGYPVVAVHHSGTGHQPLHSPPIAQNLATGLAMGKGLRYYYDLLLCSHSVPLLRARQGAADSALRQRAGPTVDPSPSLTGWPAPWRKKSTTMPMTLIPLASLALIRFPFHQQAQG